MLASISGSDGQTIVREQIREFRIKENDQYTLWNYDTPTPYHKNLYGSHPFYLEHRLDTGKSHGVFLRNSNGMDINTTQSSITYQIIGGIIDFYFFMGPDPEMVVSQYLDLIGRPAVPPYWSLGFHQCRWGYKDLQNLEDVVANYSKANIPLETIWNDIDYMDKFKDFTFDPENFPVEKMQNFVKNLHSNNQHYVVIVDPGIAIDKNYTPYTEGLQKDVFIKNHKGEVFTGKVWPGFTTYPDFLNTDTISWWGEQMKKFLRMVAIDGIWLDMNEASNFCDGECKTEKDEVKLSLDLEPDGGMLQFDPNNPPYAINNQNGKYPLNKKTLDMDAYHHVDNTNILVYNTHNLYGLTECISTRKALLQINPDQRPFILSRSTFPASGVYAAHWTGDNHATWDDIYVSVPDMLNFQLFGIPFVGSDICGFNGDTTEELCGRWMALGAFYPFSRNHNINTGVPQEAYRWESVASISREMLMIRYRLLPYLYTQFVLANKGSELPSHQMATVVKPLFFKFPKDEYSLSVDWQFFFGPAVMVSQVFQSNTNMLKVYFPPGKWYDWFTQEIIISTDKGLNKTLSTPKDKIQLHVLGGNILTTQAPGMTTTECRKGDFSLLIALDNSYKADGLLYLDDGFTINTKSFVYIQYTAKPDGVGNTVIHAVVTKKSGKCLDLQVPNLNTVTVLGLKNKPLNVEVNGVALKTDSYSFTKKILKISKLTISMEAEWNMKIVEAK
ncbi:hypothetical protein LOD99_1640 [Oopsacas minuta]|uniref:Maltase n=1 Tax=Oopsacas minuta TaxID=111878 RepID=A0AAV7K4R3_9METZ|nr:hypothetical protein LOD99_1640 [Oopsacas minuta]